LGLSNVIYQKPFFSNDNDVPSKAKVFGGKEFRVQSNAVKNLPIYNSLYSFGHSETNGKGFRYWEPDLAPPSRSEIQKWLDSENEGLRKPTRPMAELSTQKQKERISQIEGPTPKNPFGYKNTPTKVAASIAVEKDLLDTLSLELHCNTREGLLPDPKFDSVNVIFYCWQTERERLISNGWMPG
jgi:DNA polymerase zeta